jgi:hypothetical protein
MISHTQKRERYYPLYEDVGDTALEIGACAQTSKHAFMLQFCLRACITTQPSQLGHCTQPGLNFSAIKRLQNKKLYLSNDLLGVC